MSITATFSNNRLTASFDGGRVTAELPRVAVSATFATVGRKGDQGDPGEGVPTGGTTGQALVKTSAADYATGWAAPAPAAHASTHADGGSDEITVSQDQVTGLTSDLAGKTDDADLPYSVVVPAIVQTNAANATSGAVTQEYFATCLFNVRAFAGAGQDGYMEWTFFVAAGTYTLRTMWRAVTNGGIASISIDGGAALGTTIDTYAAANASNNITDITGIALTAGRHTIRFTGATKNASSTAYAITLHGFSLTRTGA